MLGVFGSLLVALAAAAVIALFKGLAEFREFRGRMLSFESNVDDDLRRNDRDHHEIRQEIKQHPQICSAFHPNR
jgi:hypothetical protein